MMYLLRLLLFIEMTVVVDVISCYIEPTGPNVLDGVSTDGHGRVPLVDTRLTLIALGQSDVD